MPVDLRRLSHGDMAQTALLFRAVFDATYPWMPALHSSRQDRAYFEGEVFDSSELWGAFEGDVLVGFIALAPGWVEKLYVRPTHHRRGIGRLLLDFAKDRQPYLRLWTFTANTRARRFYEANGFVAIHETDGTGNEQHEPDVLYQWRRPHGAA